MVLMYPLVVCYSHGISNGNYWISLFFFVEMDVLMYW